MVPQGSIIGPLLFLLQFNTAYKVLKHSKIITYADDTVVIYVSSTSLDEIEKKLSEDLTILKSWFDNNELTINLKKGKTESMIFGTSKRLNKLKSRVMEIELNGEKYMERPTISTSGFIWIKLLPLKITLAKLTSKQLVG